MRHGLRVTYVLYVLCNTVMHVLTVTHVLFGQLVMMMRVLVLVLGLGRRFDGDSDTSLGCSRAQIPWVNDRATAPCAHFNEDLGIFSTAYFVLCTHRWDSTYF